MFVFSIAVLFIFGPLITRIFAQETYPQVDISGYKKIEASFLNVDAAHLFQAQTMLGGYYASGPWQERLKLKITAKLNEKLSVSFDVEQQPDLPERQNVSVRYDKTELLFGVFNATFGGNEYASTTKFLDGVMLTSKDQWYDLTLVPSSKLKSYTQFLATQRGNNTRGPYNLGHTSIIEGSETIELNNSRLRRGVDYTIDYFEGKVTFSRILSPEDEFKYIYEYTNIIDLFFPTISKRDFIGLRFYATQLNQALWGGESERPEKLVKGATEFFPTMLTIGQSEIVETEEIMMKPEVLTSRITEEATPFTDIFIGKTQIARLYDSSLEAMAPRINTTVSKIKELIENETSTLEIIISLMDGNFGILVEGEIVILADKEQADIQKTSAEALALAWKKSLISGLLATPEVRTITVTPEEEIVEEFEWESTGTYKLKNTPVLPYSEVLYYGGTELKKYEDYIIDYQNGTITLFSPTLPTPTEPLRIDYRYIEIAIEAEILPGAGFGPYHLSHKDVIQGSEIVMVNNIPYVRDLDYVIDYGLGSILFATSISPTSNIQIKYRHVVMVTPPAPVAPEVPAAWSLGATYLQESGKSGAVAPSITVQQSFKGSDIINNNYTIYLNFRPMTSTSEVYLKRNGTIMTYEVDYVIPTVDASTGVVVPQTKLAFLNDSADRSDGLYTGTIKYLTTLEAADTVLVTYTYKKWSQERFTGIGNSATRTYYLGALRDIVPGSELVQIWRKNVPNPTIKTLAKNSSIEVYDGHYSFNYTNPPNITFNNDPIVVDGETFYLNDINFMIMFKFVPTGMISQIDISHKVYGTDTSLKWGDSTISFTVAKSETDQIYVTASTNETFNGTGTQETFILHSPDKIIEGSESVFVNSQKLNKDIHYYFTYELPGRITFYAIKPSTLDVISIDYDYQYVGGLGGKKLKEGAAYTISGSTKPLKDVELSAEYKKVDPTFDPLGGTSIPIGGEFAHFYSKQTPLQNFWINEDYKKYKNPIGNPLNELFLNSDDTNIAGGFNPYGLAQIDFGYRYYSIIDDVAPGNPHENDSQLFAYSMGISPRAMQYGMFVFSPRLGLSRSLTQNDVSSRDSIVDFGNISGTLDFTRTRLGLGYQVSKTTTSSREIGSDPLEDKEAGDINSNLNIDMTFAPIKRLSTYWNRQGHNEFDFVNKSVKSTLNETYHMDFVPVDPITTSINHDRQETLTVFTALGNPKLERTTTNIRFIPYMNTSLSWARSIDDSVQETGTKTSGWSNTYTLNHIPMSESLYKFTTDYTLSLSSRNAPLGSEASVMTDTRSFSQNYGLTITPLSQMSVSGGYIQEDYINTNDSIVTPVDTRSKNQTFSLGTAYKFTSDLEISANFSRKLTITGNIYQKTNTDFHAVYRVFTYGTLNYDLLREQNKGEILSGSLVEQDFIKDIHALTLNLIFPQTGETVLSSIVFKVGWKYADFTDNKYSANSFRANLLSFEGSLNF